MGKAEEMSDKVPAMSAQTEASKLLEQALLQMDGIISGNSGTLKAHSPDYNFVKTKLSVNDAANTLVELLQNTTSNPAPEPHVEKILLQWLKQVQATRRSWVSRHFIFSCD